MTLIELGEISSGSPEPPAAPPRRADIRRIAVTAVAALCVLTVTGSARPEPRALPQLWSMPIGSAQFNLTADMVFLLDQPGASVRAYAAADGAPRWSRPIDREAGWFSTEIPGTLLVPTTSGVLADGTSPAVTETLAVDAATGAVRWRRPGDVSLGTAEAVMLVDWDNVRNGLRGLRMIRTTDGGQLWALSLAEVVMSWTVTGAEPRRPDRLVTLTQAGAMQVRRLTDGVLVAEAAVPRLETPREDAYTHVFSNGPHLFVVRIDGLVQKITAYDVDSLRPRWERTGESAFGAFGCGALLCAGTAESEVDALDPATGQVRWHAAGWDFARPVGDGTLLVESHRTSSQALVDADTGRTLADLGTGMSVLDPEAGTVLGVRLTESPPPRFAIRQFDDATGEVILRGAVPVSGDHGCQLAAGRLACSGGGVLTVTDVG
jgi:outer membrane protein assembly factor BamB